jgi:hypothetical protein
LKKPALLVLTRFPELLEAEKLPPIIVETTE